MWFHSVSCYENVRLEAKWLTRMQTSRARVGKPMQKRASAFKSGKLKTRSSSLFWLCVSTLFGAKKFTQIQKNLVWRRKKKMDGWMDGRKTRMSNPDASLLDRKQGNGKHKLGQQGQQQDYSYLPINVFRSETNVVFWIWGPRPPPQKNVHIFDLVWKEKNCVVRKIACPCLHVLFFDFCGLPLSLPMLGLTSAHVARPSGWIWGPRPFAMLALGFFYAAELLWFGDHIVGPSQIKKSCHMLPNVFIQARHSE